MRLCVMGLIMGVALTACGDDSTRSGGGIQIAAALESDRYAKGAPIIIGVNWKGAPAGATMVVALVRDGEDRFRYDGPTGMIPLADASGRRRWMSEVNPSGHIRITWPGRGFWCAPTDYPKICDDELEVGRYRVQVTLRGAEIRPSRRTWFAPFGSGREEIATVRTSAFLVTGLPDFESLKNHLFWRVRNSIDTNRLGLASYPEAGTSRDIRVREEGDRYCFDVPVEAPFRSPVIFCFARADLVGPDGVERMPAAARDESPLTIPQMKGVMSREEAITSARDIATPPYLKRVRWQEATSDGTVPRSMGPRSSYNADPMATTYVSNPVAGAHYRHDLNGWIVSIHEMMAGGGIPDADPRRFQDQVMVFAGTGDRTCVIETKTRDGRFLSDPRTVKPICA